MKIPNIIKPENPNFSCGPTRKPCGWSIKNINKMFLGRYHRSSEVSDYIKNIILKVKTILKIPAEYELFITPGSTTGAMESVIWSFLGERKITSIVYDYWADLWNKDLKKLKFNVESRISMNGEIPSLESIDKENDLLFVWTGTSTGMTINNMDFIKTDHEGLVITDITSAAFIYQIPWKKIDLAVFSWQKALGGEAQHGMVAMSPKAKKRLKKKKNLPKVLDLANRDFLVNTPSILAISDLEICLDIFNKNGGMNWSSGICKQNKKVIDDWLVDNKYLRKFSQDKIFDALTPSYLIPKQKININGIFDFLSRNNIANDIENYRKAPRGIRIWTGPTIKKKDLIALTNWLDWCFKNIN